jgi:hypothetical protein
MADGLSVGRRVRDRDRRCPHRVGTVAAVTWAEVTVEWEAPTHQAPSHRPVTTLRRRRFLERFELLG